MGAGGPEVGDWGADDGVVVVGVLVDVAGVCDLALCRRVDAVDLGRGQVPERGHLKLLGQRVDARVLEQLVARLVDIGERRVRLELPGAGHLAREVVARVQEFEETSDGIDVAAGQVDMAGLDGERHTG